MKYALLLFSLLGTLGLQAQEKAAAPAVTVQDDGAGEVSVTIKGRLFTRLHYRKFAKPILYPIIGPTGAGLTRQWPVEEKAGPGEETDHPHHKSLWFTHGSVNGVDFWAEGEKCGKIVVSGKPGVSTPGETAVIQTAEDWMAPDGKKVCTSATTITCGLDGADRFIDYAITVTASEGEVTFGDTKEGTMGLRSHPALNLKGKVAAGHAVNSEGLKDGAIWGQPARWVDYSGLIDGQLTGIACFDHPGNLRHPTTWHARDYGLIAANPFGLHDFDKKNTKGTGDYVLKKGSALTLRYRWLFHTGDAEAARVAARWKEWAGR